MRTRYRNLTISGANSRISLEDLRWLVKETERAPKEQTVNVYVGRGDRPGQVGEARLSVDLPEAGS